MKARFVVLAAVVMTGGAAAAWARPVSLPEALAMARANNPALRAAHEAALSAAQDVKAAGSAYFPEIGAFAGYSATNQPVAAFGVKLNQGAITAGDFAPDLLNHPDSIDNLRYGIRVRQVVYAGGERRWGRRAADFGRQAAAETEAKAESDVRFAVVSAYLSALESREQIRLLEQAVEMAGRIQSKVQSLYDQGVVTRSDQLSAELRLSRLEQDLLTARAAVRLADTALATAVGVEPGDALEPGDAPADPGAEAEDAAVWHERSVAERADLAASRLRVEQARSAVRMARGAFMPGVEVNGGYEWNSEDVGSPEGSYGVGVQAGWTVFDGGRREARVEKARRDLAAAEAMIESMKRGIYLDVEQALQGVETARGQLRIGDAAIRQAEEAFRIIEDRYGAGLTGVVELLRIEYELTEARVRRTRSLYAYHQATAGLRRAAGQEIE